MARWLFVAAMLASPSVWAATGGPDGVGYRWIDSSEEGGPSTAIWQDQWTSGQPVITADDTNVTVQLNPAFAFEFYGQAVAGEVTVYSNGHLILRDPQGYSESWTNVRRLPDNNPPDSILAPCWTDINPASGRGSGVWVHSNAQEFVVVWFAPAYNDNPNNQNEVAVRLTPDGRIEYLYRTIYFNLPTPPGAISVGMESPDGQNGLSVYYGDGRDMPNPLNDYAVRFWWEPLAYDPVIEPIDDRVVSVGATLQFDVVASDQDEGQTVTLSVANLPVGATFNPETGRFRWQPTADQVGVHTVTFIARDDGNPVRSAEEQVTITVQRTNVPPEVTSTPVTEASSNVQYSYDIDAVDADGDAITYQLRRNASPQGATINSVTGVVTWTPGPEHSGEIVSFAVVVRDDAGGITLHSWQVSVDNAGPVNNPPQISSTPPTTAYVGQQLRYQVVASDPDGHAITYGIFRCPAGASIDGATGLFTWTPGNGDLGRTITCIVTVRDSEGMLGEGQSMNISVQEEAPPPNAEPVFNTQPSLTAVVGGRYTYDANAVDPEGTAVRYSLSQSPVGAFVDANTGLVNWSPSQAQLGSQQTFVLIAEDADGLQAQQTWVVTVSDVVNRPPQVTSTPPATATAGQAYVYAVTAVDPDGDPVSFELNEAQSPAGATISPAGQLRWTPGADLIGQRLSFWVIARDVHGAEFPHIFSVLVEANDGNSDPVISSTPGTSARVGEAYAYTVVASDADGDALNFTFDVLPAGAVVAGSTLRWTPVDAQAGQNHSVAVTVTDGNGGRARQTWIVAVDDVVVPNNPPQFTSQPAAQASVGIAYRYDATWRDPDGHAVTFRMVSGPTGMTAEANGSVRWTPSPAQADQSFEAVFEISDSEGARTEQRITIVVGPDEQNGQPTFTTEPAGQASVGQAYAYRPAAIDPDDDPLTFNLVSAPAGATFVGGLISWTPTAQQGDQIHDFVLTVSDGNGGQAEQRWRVAVSSDAGNRAPVITSEPVTAASVGLPYRYNVTATDPDDDRLVFLLPENENPPAGMTIDPSTGQVNWVPGAEYGGQQVRVVVGVVDEGGLFDAQAFTIGVGVPANGAPNIISNAPATAQVQVQYVYQVVAEDPEGDTLRYFTDPDRCPDGVSIHVLTGRLTWTPSLADAGNEVTCLIGVVDPFDNADLQIITVRVDGEVQNSDPVIISQPLTGATQGNPYVYNITANDADGDELTYTLVEGPAGARLVSRGPVNGIIWLVPNGSNGRSFDFEVRVSDGRGGVATQRWTVTVGGGNSNQPPIITSTPGLSASPGVAYSYRVQAFDIEQQSLSYTLDAAPAGATISNSGNLVWTPSAGQAGQSFAFRLIVRDSAGGEARQSWEVTVTGEPPPPANNPPVITSQPVTAAGQGDLYQYDVEATDADGDPLFWVLPDDQNPPEGMSIDASTGVISWRPSDQGRFQVTVAVTDGTAWAAQRFEISVEAGQANQPPVFTSDPPTEAVAGEQLVYQATGEDPEGDAIRFTLIGDQCPQGMTVNAVTGQLLWTPPASLLGTQVSCVLVISDAQGLSNTQSLAISVTDGTPANRAPRIVSTPPELAVVDQAYVYAAQGTDADGDPLGWALTAAPAGAFLDANTGRLTWTPDVDDLGTVAFAIELRDGRGGVHRQQWEVRVERGNPNNEAPRITSSPSTSARVGQAYLYAAAAVDPDGDSLSWRIVEAPVGAVINAETGALSWLPSAQYENQLVVFQLEVSDGNAADRQRWSLVVQPQVGGNNAPVISSSPPRQVLLGDDYATRLSATDADNDPLSWRLVNAPAGASLASNGALEWRPNLGDLGQTLRFSVQVSDGRGGSDTLSWEVTVPNRAPEITSTPTTEAQVGLAYVYAVAASDEDPGQPLRYSFSSRVPAGMVIHASTGRVTWLPNDSHAGRTYNIVIRVEDSLGAFDEQSYQLGVETPVENRAPVISNRAPERASAGEEYSYDYEATDPDGDALSWRLDAAPAGMTIDADTGIIRWNVPQSAVGQTVSVVVVVRDPEGLFDRHEVLVLVERIANNPPTFGNEPDRAGVVDEPYRFVPRVSDEDGDPVSVQLVLSPPGAACSDAGCNELTWTPEQSGSFAFRLVAEDDRGAQAELRWTVEVTEPQPNAAPIFNSTPVTQASVGVEYSYTASANDPDGDELAYSLAAISPVAMAIDALTGQITWTPTADDIGVHPVVVEVRDGRGGSDLQSYQLEVVDENINRAPVVTSEPITEAFVDLLYSYRVRAHDLDEDPLTFELKAGPGGMVIDADGLVQWTPVITDAGQSVLVQVEVSDGQATVLHSWVIDVSDEVADLIVDAGEDRSVDPGVIELDGSQTADPMGRAMTFLWTFKEGPEAVTVDDPSLQNATVELLVPGFYVFGLHVETVDGRSGDDEVVIEVRYNGPVARAGDDQALTLPVTGDPIAAQLSGQAIVAEGDVPNFLWQQVHGPPVEMEGADTANPSFKVFDPGVYMFELVVEAGSEQSLPDVVVVSVAEPDDGTTGEWGVDETACGCAGSPFGDAAWLLFLLPLMRRRRRIAA